MFTMGRPAKFDDITKGPLAGLPLRWLPLSFSYCGAVQLRCAQKVGGRKRHYRLPAIASIFLLTSLSTSVRSNSLDEAMPKMVRKGWGKPSREFMYDAYVTVARPLFVKLGRKAQRIGNRLLHPDYHILGRAWFNAFLVDMSEYILRRSTCAGLEEELFEGESSVQPQEPRSRPGTQWTATSSQLVEAGYQAAEEVLAGLRPAKDSAFKAPGTAEPEEEYPPNEEDSSSSGQVVKLNMPTIVRWKESFESIFMEVAKKTLPHNVLELVKSMDENQYSELRPMLEHALYRTLTEFYPTLMSTEISEAILPNFHVAVSCDTCPFSLYTSYTFMALIAAGRSGVDGLFLADEMMQHYKDDEPYISPECQAFNDDMTEALIMDSMTLYELVGRTAGAARSSFYTLPNLVKLQKATLLGTDVKSKDADKEGYQSLVEKTTKEEAALREMVEALSPELKRYDHDGSHQSVSPRYVMETFERVKATPRDPTAPTTKVEGNLPHHKTQKADPLASLILKQKSGILRTSKRL